MTRKDLTRRPLPHLRAFLRDEGGSAVIESMMIIPVILMAWIGTYAFWEAFSARGTVQKANFAVADILSREMVPVTDTFLDGLDTTMEYMVGPRFDVSARFTVYSKTGPNDTDVAVLWSYSPGTAMAVLTTAGLQARGANLPKLTTGSTAIVVDTQMAYSVPFRIPIASYVVPSSFSDTVVLRPRYLAKLCRAGATTC